MRAAADERSVEINGLAIMTPDTPEIDRYYSQQVVNGFVLPVEKVVGVAHFMRAPDEG